MPLMQSFSKIYPCPVGSQGSTPRPMRHRINSISVREAYLALPREVLGTLDIEG